jgi:hypothetical protein
MEPVEKLYEIDRDGLYCEEEIDFEIDEYPDDLVFKP